MLEGILENEFVCRGRVKMYDIDDCVRMSRYGVLSVNDT